MRQLEDEILRLRRANPGHARTAANAMQDSVSTTSSRIFPYNGETASAASVSINTDDAKLKLQSRKRSSTSGGVDLQATITLLTDENQMLRRQLRLAEKEVSSVRMTLKHKLLIFSALPAL